LNKKQLYLLAIGLISTLIALVLDLKAGSYNISLIDLFNTLSHPNIDDDLHTLVFGIRLPKTLMALAAGALLAQCGLLMQTYFQNPLAGPYVLGISSGASFGAALFIMSPITLIWPNIQHVGLVGCAFLGAALVTLLLLALTYKNNQIIVVLIIGILMNYFISSLQSMVEYYASANKIKNFNTWSFGHLNSVGLSELKYLMPIALILSLGFLLLSRPLNLLAAGKENAIALGLNYKRFSILLIILTAVTTAIVTSYCGPISFIGMVVPFCIKWWTKSNAHFFLLLSSALFGATVLLVCDFISYRLFPEQYIPINIILGLLGIPIIILYLVKNKGFQH
jgi:iron complex transport system permease protein